jgi:REP element-mobilizing transposase RayT
MPHSYSQTIAHIVFSTKGRVKFLSPALQPQLWSYLAGICQNEKIGVHAIGGTDDHIHCLLQIPATLTLAKTVSVLKANSSRWIALTTRGFAWQQSYASFSVSASLVPTVARYVQHQQAHHRKMSFEDEFLALLRKHGVEYDPKFVLG